MATTFKDVMTWLGTKEFLDLTPQQYRQLVGELNQQMKLKKVLAVGKFRQGDTVKFQGKRGEHVRGVVTRGNKTTITVVADNGLTWRVSPALLQKV